MLLVCSNNSCLLQFKRFLKQPKSLLYGNLSMLVFPSLLLTPLTDPDAFSARISAQQAYAQKLQDKYDKQAEDYQAKLKEKEARKKQEVLNLLNQEGGHRLGGSNDTSNTKPKSFRPEYNPLMGPGSSSNYRPPKKSKCGGGGCGK